MACFALSPALPVEPDLPLDPALPVPPDAPALPASVCLLAPSVLPAPEPALSPAPVCDCVVLPDLVPAWVSDLVPVDPAYVGSEDLVPVDLVSVDFPDDVSEPVRVAVVVVFTVTPLKKAPTTLARREPGPRCCRWSMRPQPPG